MCLCCCVLVRFCLFCLWFFILSISCCKLYLVWVVCDHLCLYLGSFFNHVISLFLCLLLCVHTKCLIKCSSEHFIHLLSHWTSNLFVIFGYDLWSCFSIMVVLYHRWVDQFFINSYVYAISALCVACVCDVVNTFCSPSCVFVGVVVFVLQWPQKHPHPTKENKRWLILLLSNKAKLQIQEIHLNSILHSRVFISMMHMVWSSCIKMFAIPTLLWR